MYAIPKVVLICSAILLPLILTLADNPKNVSSETEAVEAPLVQKKIPAGHHGFDIEKLISGFR